MIRRPASPSPAQSAAALYLDCGWAPTPLLPRGKVPLLTDWPERRLGLNDLFHFAGRRNIGLVVGPPSGGLVDVDCDWPEAARLAPSLLPTTGLAHGRSGSPLSHWWYCADDARTQVLRLRAPWPGRKQVVVELRAARLVTAVPPSTHPSGQQLTWERWGAPHRVEGLTLQGAVARLAAAAVLCACRWPPERAISFVRDPAPRALAHWDRRLERHLSLRAWLGVGGARDQPDTPRIPYGKLLLPQLASPATFAVLSAVGDVVTAGRLLGLDLREGRQPCPFHRGHGARSLQVTRCLWRCWAGCGAGNAIHLAALLLGVDYRSARAELARRAGLTS